MLLLPILAHSQIKGERSLDKGKVGIVIGSWFGASKAAEPKSVNNVKHRWRTGPWRKKGRDLWKQSRMCMIHKEKQERWAGKNAPCN